MPTCIGVSHGSNQHRPCVGRHVQAICNQCQRANITTTDDFDDHHHATQRYHTPRFTFTFLMSFAQEHMRMFTVKGGIVEVIHWGLKKEGLFKIATNNANQLFTCIAVLAKVFVFCLHQMRADVIL